MGRVAFLIIAAMLLATFMQCRINQEETKVPEVSKQNTSEVSAFGSESIAKGGANSQWTTKKHPYLNPKDTCKSETGANNLSYNTLSTKANELSEIK